MATYHIRTDAEGWTIFNLHSREIACSGDIRFEGMAFDEATYVAKLLNALHKAQIFEPKRRKRQLRLRARRTMRNSCVEREMAAVARTSEAA